MNKLRLTRDDFTYWFGKKRIILRDAFVDKPEYLSGVVETITQSSVEKKLFEGYDEPVTMTAKIFESIKVTDDLVKKNCCPSIASKRTKQDNSLVHYVHAIISNISGYENIKFRCQFRNGAIYPETVCTSTSVTVIDNGLPEPINSPYELLLRIFTWYLQLQPGEVMSVSHGAIIPGIPQTLANGSIDVPFSGRMILSDPHIFLDNTPDDQNSIAYKLMHGYVPSDKEVNAIVRMIFCPECTCDFRNTNHRFDCRVNKLKYLDIVQTN